MPHQFLQKESSLFQGMDEEEIQSVLTCLPAKRRRYEKGETIFPSGHAVDEIGMVLEGQVHLLKEDRWGNAALLSSIAPGEIFGESYACLPGIPLPLRAQAAAACEILLLPIQKVWTVCSSACRFHTKLMENLLAVLAQKNLFLAQKADILAQRTVREKLLTYLFYQSKAQASPSFSIALNRQQLADYLAVDRSSMTVELGKLCREGVLKVERNRFTLL